MFVCHFTTKLVSLQKVTKFRNSVVCKGGERSGVSGSGRASKTSGRQAAENLVCSRQWPKEPKACGSEVHSRNANANTRGSIRSSGSGSCMQRLAGSVLPWVFGQVNKKPACVSPNRLQLASEDCWSQMPNPSRTSNGSPSEPETERGRILPPQRIVKTKKCSGHRLPASKK